MAVQDILQEMYGYGTPENAQQGLGDGYRQQLMNDYLNTNLSSSNMGQQAPDPSMDNFRQSLFYSNFLQSEADRKAQAEAEKAANDAAVRGQEKPPVEAEARVPIEELYNLLERPPGQLPLSNPYRNGLPSLEDAPRRRVVSVRSPFDHVQARKDMSMLRSKNDYDETLNYLRERTKVLQADYDGTGPLGPRQSYYISHKPDISREYQDWFSKANKALDAAKSKQ